jgi:predicted ArsR family transcriptional regulator
MDAPGVPPALEALAVLLEPRRRQLYRYVERQPNAVSRDQAADALGISRSLAAFHLDKLVGAGLLEADFRRLTGRSGPGAGRTAKLYRRSRLDVSVSVPHRDFELLARLLAESASSDRTDAPGLEPAMTYGRTLGTQARERDHGPTTPARLLATMEGVLDDLGFEPYRASAVEVRLRNCPFDPLARQHTPVVCGVGQALMEGLAEGVGEDRLHVRREPHPDRCCGVITAAS